MSDSNNVLIQPAINNLLITRSPNATENDLSTPPKGVISLVIRQLKGNLIFSSDFGGSINLPLVVKVHVHSLNLLEIENAFKNKDVQGITTQLCIGRYTTQVNFANFKEHFKEISILELISDAQIIKWVRNGILLTDISGVELNDGEELIISLIMEIDGKGGISAGFNW